jgi:hypothetical protein
VGPLYVRVDTFGSLSRDTGKTGETSTAQPEPRYHELRGNENLDGTVTYILCISMFSSVN